MPLSDTVVPGNYELIARVKAPEYSRLDLTVGGLMVASYGVDQTWSEESAVVHLEPGEPVGVRAFDRWDDTLPVDLDWIRYEPVGPLVTVRGTELVGLDGTPLRLRGANRAGYQNWTYGAAQYNDPRHEGVPMAEWGMNAVRLLLNEEFWLLDCPLGTRGAGSTVHDDPNDRRYREVVREEVDRFVAAGLYVVLDLHITGQGNPCPRDFEVEHKSAPMANRPRSIPFWRSVADEFGNEPMVGFDLFNEPYVDALGPVSRPSDPDGVWRNGGTIRQATEGRTELAGMQELYDAVRGRGARNLVFVSGLRWAADIDVLMRRPLNGFGIVAATHPYCDEDCDLEKGMIHRWAFGEWEGQDDVIGTADRFPTVGTEFGAKSWGEGSSPDDVGRIVDWHERHGLGWLVYNWAPGNSGNPWGILDQSAYFDETLDDQSRRVPNPNGQRAWEVLGPLHL